MSHVVSSQLRPSPPYEETLSCFLRRISFVLTIPLPESTHRNLKSVHLTLGYSTLFRFRCADSFVMKLVNLLKTVLKKR